MLPQITHIVELEGVKTWSLPDGSNTKYFIDFAQNVSGYLKLNFNKLKLKSGQTLTLRHAEVLTHPP